MTRSERTSPAALPAFSPTVTSAYKSCAKASRRASHRRLRRLKVLKASTAGMATAGSAAPYIGLLGTVWGIYHALVRIGLSGQGTLDKVAGPVGEALIMTAMGLAVAIPAVLAYNTFNRRNRLWLARLDAFAHDLYALVTVGEKANSSAGEVRPLRVIANGG